MNCKRLSFFLIIAASIISCTGNDRSNLSNVSPDLLYFDYRVTGDEDAGYITVRLQYRLVDAGGPALLTRGKVELDGTTLKADSSKMNGAYFEMTKPVKEFTGHHNIVFTDRNGKQYKEEFDFQPISLKQAFPAVINRGDLSFDVDGLATKDYLKVMLTDTVRFGAGIERIDTVNNGHVVITMEDFEALANGPVNLQISREVERGIKNGTRRGGKRYMSYELKREFELKD